MSAPSSPLVSIILPTYNRGDLLLEAVGSVRDQTYSRWELVIADDGSTDDSLSALPDDARIRTKRLAHSGNVATVRNAGLAAATGSLIGFLDSDDRWRPEKLLRQVARLEARPEAGWCYGQHDLIDAQGQPAPCRSGPVWHPREGLIAGEIMRANAGVALQSVIVRREIAAGLRFDERLPFADDHDFLVRLALAWPACVVDAIVADIRDHAGRITNHRYEQTLAIAMAYGRYRGLVSDPALKRVCARRRRGLIRSYLSRMRAAGQLRQGVARLARAWIGVRRQNL